MRAYLTYTLSDVIVTRVDHEAKPTARSRSRSSRSRMVQGHGLLQSRSASGKIGTPVTAGWDVKANKPL